MHECRGLGPAFGNNGPLSSLYWFNREVAFGGLCFKWCVSSFHASPVRLGLFEESLSECDKATHWSGGARRLTLDAQVLSLTLCLA